MNPASYDVRVDWSGDGSFDEVGDDISGRVFDRGTPLTLQYGRDQARAFAPLSGGRGQFELDNTSRDYSPENTSSPLVGKLLPGRDVRIQATLGVTTALNANPFFEAEGASAGGSNPGFESGTSAWTATSATIAASQDFVKVGSFSGKLTADGGANPRVTHSQSLTFVTAGQPYQISGWLYAPVALPSTASITIQWYTAGGAFISQNALSATLTAGVWTYLEGAFTAPATAERAARQFSMNGTPVAGTLLYGDDMQVRVATPANWTSTGTFVRSTAQAHEGVASGLLTPDGVSATARVTSNHVAATVAGVGYRGSAWVRCATSRNVQLEINWYDAGNAFLSSNSTGATVVADTWTLLDFTAPAPAGTAFAAVQVSMYTTPPITDLLYVDQAQLTNAPAGLFRGNMDGFTVLPAIEQQSVQVTLLDALSRLKTQRVTTTLYSGLRTGDAIGLLLDAVGWTAGRDLDPGASTLPFWWADDTEAFTLLQSILDAEGPGCLATVGADGSFIFRDRHHRLLRAASVTVQATLRSDGAEPCYSDLEYDQGWSDIVNSVGFAIPVRAPSGERSQVWQMSGQRSIADGETVLLSASSSTPFFRAVVPEAGTDFTVLSGTVTVVLSGTSGASVTVLVTAVGGPAVIDGMALRAYPLVTQATVLVMAEDSTSVARYGRRSWQSGRDPDLAGLPDALAIADIILAHRAERLPTVTITLKGGVSERMVQQLTRDLSDRVHITDAGSGLDADCWVEQIAHTAANGDHVTVFGCEKIPTPPTGLLVLNDAAAGLLDTGKLGGIGLSAPTTVFILDDAAQGKLDTVTALLGV